MHAKASAAQAGGYVEAGTAFRSKTHRLMDAYAPLHFDDTDSIFNLQISHANCKVQRDVSTSCAG